MAIPIVSSSSFLRFFIGFSLFLGLFLCSSVEKSFALAGGKTNSHLQHTRTVELNSLLPATSCSPSTKGHNKNKEGSVLKVVHKHGPCYEPNKPKTKHSIIQILEQDQARVNSIHSQFKNSNTKNNVDPITQSDATTLPAQSATVVGGLANYIVTVGLGTPAKQLSLAFDTGSDLTWTQCQPCLGHCYQQSEPIFDPSLSTSYANISCTSSTCPTARCFGPTATCVYYVGYGDGSNTSGFLATEKLTITSTDVFDGFIFGCGQSNNGDLLRGDAGLIGLGRNKISIVQQTAQKYGQYFSYCLPPNSRSTGFLRLGQGGGASNAVSFTPLTTISQGKSFYGLDLVGISVGGQKLSIPASVFSSPGTIIDSGTVITRLPATAYVAMRDAFREGMKSLGYPPAPELSIFDTCYDLSAFEGQSVSFPAIEFEFGGGVKLDLEVIGIVIVAKPSQVCLAFAGIKQNQNIPGIIGNIAQLGLEVVYDVAGGKLGFSHGGC